MGSTPTIKHLEWEHIIFSDGDEEWRVFPLKDLLKYSITRRRGSITFRLYINHYLKEKTNDLNEAMCIAQTDFERKIKERLE